MVCEPGQALVEARALAARITKNSPAAVAASIRALQDVRGPAEALGWTATDHAIAAASHSPDWSEGTAAFLDKRAPRWQR